MRVYGACIIFFDCSALFILDQLIVSEFEKFYNFILMNTYIRNIIMKLNIFLLLVANEMKN